MEIQNPGATKDKSMAGTAFIRSCALNVTLNVEPSGVP
jgi:hypothetical protein